MELLVVVALIAIVAALVFPVFVEARLAASDAGCKANLKQIGSALQLYRDDWGSTALADSGERAWGEGGWTEKLYAYHHSTAIYRCPARNVNFAYALNDKLDSVAASKPARPCAFIAVFEVPGSGVGEVKVDDSNGILSGNANMTGRACHASATGASVLDHEWTGSKAPADYSALFFPGPHNGGSNVLFYDGHVRRFADWTFGAMTFDPESTGYYK